MLLVSVCFSLHKIPIFWENLKQICDMCWDPVSFSSIIKHKNLQLDDCEILTLSIKICRALHWIFSPLLPKIIKFVLSILRDNLFAQNHTLNCMNSDLMFSTSI